MDITHFHCLLTPLKFTKTLKNWFCISVDSMYTERPAPAVPSTLSKCLMSFCLHNWWLLTSFSRVPPESIGAFEYCRWRSSKYSQMGRPQAPGHPDVQSHIILALNMMFWCQAHAVSLLSGISLLASRSQYSSKGLLLLTCLYPFLPLSALPHYIPHHLPPTRSSICIHTWAAVSLLQRFWCCWPQDQRKVM